MNQWSRIVVAVLFVAGLSAAQTTASANSSSPKPADSSVADPVASAPIVPPAVPIERKSTGLELTTPEVPEALVPQPAGPLPSAPRKSATLAPSDGLVKPGDAGGAQPSPSVSGKPGSASDNTARYVLGPNDVVGVTVWGDKNLTGTYSIGPDGRMSMPLVGDFKAIGLTIPGLQDLITEKLTGFINDPVVNVQLLRNNSKKYTIAGAVYKQGPFPLVQETTILDAVTGAGGFKDFANPKKIVLTRGKKTYPFNYRDVVKGKNTQQNIILEDGDIIFVPGE